MNMILNNTLLSKQNIFFSFSALLKDRYVPCQMMPNPLLVSLRFSISDIAARLADVKDVHVER